jgi:hypothetical protein
MRFFGATSGNELEAQTINGEPSVVALFEGAVVAVLVLSMRESLITRIYVVSDQRKLGHVKRILDQRS